MSDLPEPLTPADCDLRGFDYIPIYGSALFASDIYLTRSAEEFRAALRLWWAAWHQRPAGSLPSGDAALAALADYGRDIESWRKVREGALHGFILCSDARLYHPLVCKVAEDIFQKRAKWKEKKSHLRSWRCFGEQPNAF